ncbi:MAG: oligosaccharide flippase family protein [Gammaproteobacteria bacterium]|nr:oligosaccharide flippase family protein [Gammaproteobacteria bacterium]
MSGRFDALKQLINPWPLRAPGALARNSLRFLTWQILRAGCLGVYLILLTRILGATTYGALSGPLSLAVIFGTLSGGGASLMLLRDTAKDGASLSLAWSRLWSASMLLAPVCVALYAIVTRLLFGSSFSWQLLTMFAASEIILLPLVTAVALAFQGREQLGTAGAIMTLPALGRLFAVIGLAVAAPTQPLMIYPMLHLSAAVLATVTAVVLLMTRNPLTWRVSILPAAWWRDCLEQSSMYFVSSATTELDKSLVLRFGAAELAGHYTLGYRIMMMLTMPAQALAQAALPRAVRQIADRSHALPRLVASMGIATLGYSGLASLALWLGGTTIISWFGPDFGEIHTVILEFCALFTLYNLRLIPCILLQAAGQPVRRASIEAVALVVLCTLSAILVPRYGLRGAVLTAMASECWILVVSLVAIRPILRQSRIA